MNKDVKNQKTNSKLPLIIVGVVVIIVAIVLISRMGNKSGAEVKTQIDTETWIEKNGTASLVNEGDKVVFTINSDLKRADGEELEIPYVLKVNDDEFNGMYTFATGYSIHSEPNAMAYRVNFIGVENEKLGIIIYKDASSEQQNQNTQTEDTEGEVTEGQEE